ncbi:MAG: hypothetical protein WCT44_03210 [Candidatus Paceibacterota bacterium]
MRSRPFEETILETISEMCIPQVELVANLILRTTINNNHDEIAVAWRERCLELGLRDHMDVVAALEFKRRSIQPAYNAVFSGIFDQ